MWNEFSSLEELNYSLNQYLENNYINKVHSSIKTTPRERFLKDYEKIRFIEKEDLEYKFLHRKECRVNNTAVIKIQTREYEVPQKYIGQKIKVRYLPFDMEKLYIFSQSSRLKLCGVNNNMFNTNTIEAIYGYCNGFPRILNNIVEKCLMIGFQKKVKELLLFILTIQII